MLVLCHLFQREPLSNCTLLKRTLAQRTPTNERCPSMVMLPPMPSAVNAVVQQYNREVRRR